MSVFEPTPPPPRIAALEATDSAAAQALMEAFARELALEGVAVAGVVQTHVVDPATGRKRIALRNLENGALYAISQDLGPGSVACNLDSSQLADACAAIERAARAGAGLVVVSKFSKQEAERGGLADAFRAAMLAKIPVLTAVSPYFLEEWRAFAGPLARFTPLDRQALREWWEAARAAT